MTPRPSWPLVLSYAAFFLPAGVLLSYLPPYLVGKGLGAAQVGLIFSAVFAVKLVMGPVLAWWADKAQQQQWLLTFAAWTSVVCVLLLTLSQRVDVVLISVVCISVCRNYFQCMLEALATQVKNRGASCYGLLRGSGSAAVCVGVVLFGGLWSTQQNYEQVVLPLMILASGFVLIACLRYVGAANSAATAPAPGLDAGVARVRPASIALLLVGATLLIGANGVFYSTATLLMWQRGVSQAEIALLWCMAFGIEALGFMAFDRLRAWCGTRWLFVAAVTLALLRWLLFALSEDLICMVVAFALHVASFSWVHAFCANWVRDAGSTKFAVTVQAVYTACAHGIGMATASYAASLLLPRLGGGVYWIAVAMTVCGAFILSLRTIVSTTPDPMTLQAS